MPRIPSVVLGVSLGAMPGFLPPSPAKRANQHTAALCADGFSTGTTHPVVTRDRIAEQNPVMKKRFEQTQRFRTRAPDGRECYMVELTTFGRIDEEPAGSWLPVNRVFRTAEGNPVQLRPDGAFVVVATGARFERV